MERRDRKPERKTEERRKNGKYCQIYHIVPSRIIHVICTTALLCTIYVWLPLCVVLLSIYNNKVRRKRRGYKIKYNEVIYDLLYIERSANAFEAKHILYRVRQWYI